MRIGICIWDLSGGGAEHTRLRTAHGLIARGHEVDFLLFQTWIHYPDEVPPAARLFALNTDPDEITRITSGEQLERCIPFAPNAQIISRIKDYISLAGAVRWNLRTLPNERWLEQAQFISSYASKENPHCILSSLHRNNLATLWATNLLPEFPPVIPTFHCDDLRYEEQKTRMRYRHLLDLSAHVVAISNGVRDDVLTFTGISPDKVSVIYNPVVTPEQDELRRKVPDHPWMIDDGPPVVLSVGRLGDQKDFPTLLKAFHVLARTRDLRLIILGEGERRQELEECIRSLNLEDKVSLPGWKANPFAFMSRAALFVLPSKFEGLGNVLIEALACGCPVVSTDCPSGPSEILEGGRVGPLVPVGDHAALADAMGRVLDDPPDKETLKQRATFFSADKAVDAYERLIVETVRKHRAASDAGTTTERRA